MNDSAAFNLFELKRYKAIKLEMIGGAMRLVFQPGGAERGLLSAFAPPPRIIESDRFEPSTAHLSPSERMFLTDDASYLAAARALLAFDVYGQAIAAAAVNNRLSNDGRRELYVEAGRTALTSVGRQFARLEAIAADLAARHAALHAPPAQDGISAPVDVYLWTRFGQQSSAEQMQIVLDGSANAERMLLALARSPERYAYAPEVLQRLDEAWAQRIAREKPVAVAELTIAEDANAWAQRIAKQIGGHLMNPSLNGTSGAIDRFDVYKLLRAVDAVNLMDPREGDVEMWERRLNSIAA